MGDMDRQQALGGLVLGLIVAGIIALRGLPALHASAALTPPDDPVIAAAFGFPVAADCPDPRVWEELPSVGPARGRALADAAAAGLLREPSDLLRVPGIGTKMAALLAPRVAFPAREPPAGEPP